MLTALIVDDSEFMRMTMRKKLTGLGLRIAGEAEGVQAALREFHKIKPDIVTLDVTMPDGSGLDCIPEMLAARRDARIIVMTSRTDQDTVIESMMLGAVAFLNKPFTDHELQETIANVSAGVVARGF